VPQYISLGYWGTPSFFEIWLTYLWVPYVLYLTIRRWRTSRMSAMIPQPTAEPGTNLSLDDAPLFRETPSLAAMQAPEASSEGMFRLGWFALLWFVMTYFPYFALYYYGRVTYPFYLVPAMPAIAIGSAFVLSRKWFPREVAYILLGGVFLWFFLYYPDKSFLPTWLRMIMGH